MFPVVPRMLLYVTCVTLSNLLPSRGNTFDSSAPMLPDCGSMQVIRVANDGRRLEIGAEPRHEAVAAVGP